MLCACICASVMEWWQRIHQSVIRFWHLAGVGYLEAFKWKIIRGVVSFGLRLVGRHIQQNSIIQKAINQARSYKVHADIYYLKKISYPLIMLPVTLQFLNFIHRSEPGIGYVMELRCCRTAWEMAIAIFCRGVVRVAFRRQPSNERW